MTNDAAALAAALKAAIPASIDENGDPIDEDRWFDSFAERLTEQAESAAYRAALPVHPPAPPRVRHGRHCPCSACAREDWTNWNRAPCDYHGVQCAYSPEDAS